MNTAFEFKRWWEDVDETVKTKYNEDFYIKNNNKILASKKMRVFKMSGLQGGKAHSRGDR